jgi:hypothetical protein
MDGQVTSNMSLRLQHSKGMQNFDSTISERSSQSSILELRYATVCCDCKSAGFVADSLTVTRTLRTRFCRAADCTHSSHLYDEQCLREIEVRGVIAVNAWSQTQVLGCRTPNFTVTGRAQPTASRAICTSQRNSAEWFFRNFLPGVL